MRSYVAVLALVGCAPGAELTTYEVGCVKLQSEVPLNQRKLEWNFQAMQALMERKGFDKTEWCERFQNVPVYVRDVDVFGKDVLGAYKSTNHSVELTRNMVGWLHEYVHHATWNIFQGVGLIDGHIAWKENGYVEIDEMYGVVAFDPTNMEE